MTDLNKSYNCISSVEIIRLSVYNIERKELVNVDYIPTLEASGK